MRAWTILLAMMVVPVLASASCNGPIMRDWGLHLQWTVERDCEHPELPARLVEVPWTIETHLKASGAKQTARLPLPEVRSGMTVSLWRKSEEADVHLRGTALGAARTGERVRVKTEFGIIPVEGIVRGPGLVELLP
jgi:hypothetical protein